MAAWDEPIERQHAKAGHAGMTRMACLATVTRPTAAAIRRLEPLLTMG
jgi:hypothetical protein|tara:strand:+ start:44 stop:187 length:144 start_codon:yes stop_codon:yes gene_type:complete